MNCSFYLNRGKIVTRQPFISKTGVFLLKVQFVCFQNFALEKSRDVVKYIIVTYI